MSWCLNDFLGRKIFILFIFETNETFWKVGFELMFSCSTTLKDFLGPKGLPILKLKWSIVESISFCFKKKKKRKKEKRKKKKMED